MKVRNSLSLRKFYCGIPAQQVHRKTLTFFCGGRKIRTRTTFIVYLTAIMTLAAGNAFGKYSGGTGEPNNPYQIASKTDLLDLAADANDYNKCFILTANINLTGLTFTQAPIAPDTNSVLSGFQGTMFAGVFDGNNHTISNLTITASTRDYVGLFGCVGGGGQIRNLGIENANVTGNSSVGGLVGSYGTLTSCYATGSVTGNSNVGGLVGSGGTLNSCYATGSVTGDSNVGGLVGGNRCGELSIPTLTACYATGSVSGTGSGVGGLVGSNRGGTLTSCYATGSVNGTDRVGGLVGYNYAVINMCWTDLIVTACYATGSVTGNSNVGGLVGSNICENYATLKLTACFWDINTSGQTVGVGSGTSTGVTGKTTAEMKTLSTFASAGWDFTTIWAICEGTNYPRLRWQIPLLGDFICPDGVEMNDLAVLCEEWLSEEIPADVWPEGGDGIVNFFDWAVFANQWQITVDYETLADFAEQWLKTGTQYCISDIAPDGGDRIVNMMDFAAFANNWLAGL